VLVTLACRQQLLFLTTVEIDKPLTTVEIDKPLTTVEIDKPLPVTLPQTRSVGSPTKSRPAIIRP
jgi:hypothetical protein